MNFGDKQKDSNIKCLVLCQDGVLTTGLWGRGGVSDQGGNRFSFVLQETNSKIMFLSGGEKWGFARM